MSRIIGITGYAGSGKDTLAGILKEKLEAEGCSVQVVSFAQPIREITYELGLDIFDRDQKEVDVTLLFDDFEEDLRLEIDVQLGAVTSQEERAELFAFFVDALVREGHLHYGPAGDTLHISPRRFAQLLGTEGGRNVHPDFWVRLLAQLCTAEYALVADIRFPNEATVCDKLWARRRDVPPVALHESEAHIAALIEEATCVIGEADTLDDLGLIVDLCIGQDNL